MLDALEHTHRDGKLLDEAAAQYHKFAIIPAVTGAGLKINTRLKTHSSIIETLTKLYKSEHTDNPIKMNFKNVDEWGEEDVDWIWHYE